MAENTVDRSGLPETTPSREIVQETREPARYLLPAVDIYETADGLTVVADVPGVGKDDLDIRVEDNVLTILGRVDRREPENVVRREFGLASYWRQFTLGDAVDRDRIEANLEQGVLSLRLPKAERARPRQIKIA